jgi:hypothetical protein
MFNYCKTNIYTIISVIMISSCAVTRSWCITILSKYGVTKERGVVLIKTLKQIQN